jgi:hypothetical protein
MLTADRSPARSSSGNMWPACLPWGPSTVTGRDGTFVLRALDPSATEVHLGVESPPLSLTKAAAFAAGSTDARIVLH